MSPQPQSGFFTSGGELKAPWQTQTQQLEYPEYQASIPVTYQYYQHQHPYPHQHAPSSQPAPAERPPALSHTHSEPSLMYATHGGVNMNMPVGVGQKVPGMVLPAVLSAHTFIPDPDSYAYQAWQSVSGAGVPGDKGGLLGGALTPTSWPQPQTTNPGVGVSVGVAVAPHGQHAYPPQAMPMHMPTGGFGIGAELEMAAPVQSGVAKWK
jgi:hypothetical protein